MTIGTIVYALAGITFLGAIAGAVYTYRRAEKDPVPSED